MKITLRHGDVLKTHCSALFVKHIEGSMSTPELGLNAATGGRLQALYSKHEKDDHTILESKGDLLAPRVYVVNFHQRDLPFSYSSVDRYARAIVRVASSGALAAIEGPMSVATAIHGPGAGLDASEAMETLLLGFSSELGKGLPLGNLTEIMLVEDDREVFDRLEERLRYLATNGIVRYEGSTCFINPGVVPNAAKRESARVGSLALRHLFVAMPYAQEFNNAYYFGIKHPVEQLGRKCERVDQDAFNGDIVERIKQRITSAELVIADITGNNPNVYFEVGYAEGIGKTVVLISQKQETPFDLKTRRQIRYDPLDILSLANALREQLDATLGNP
jgi:hypothetical protein